MTGPTERVAVTQADRDRTAEALGYRDWADATDYRLTGKQDRQRDHFLQHFARHRISASSGMEEIVGAKADLQLALDLALAILGEMEPPDSRAVSNEFVAMASISCGITSRIEECRDIIRAALARIRGSEKDGK